MDAFEMPSPGARVWVEFSDFSRSARVPISYVVVDVDPLTGVTARPVEGHMPRVPVGTACRVEYEVGAAQVIVDAVAASCSLAPFDHA